MRGASPAWATTGAYWPSLHLSAARTDAFIAGRRATIETTLLPVVREIQRAYMLRRPTP